METTDVEIRLPKTTAEREMAELPEGALQAQREEMPSQPSGAQLKLEPVLVMTVAVSVAWLVERIVDHYLPRREHGVLVDFSAGKPVVSTVDNVSEGTLIIRKPNGEVDVYRDRPRASLVDALTLGFQSGEE
jgi:hypothetical protein